MAHDLKLFELFDGMKYPKIVLAVGVVLLLFLEIGIYAAVSSQSGLRSRVVITDAGGKKIHESPGAALGPYEKMVFENNFGPLRNYNTEVESEVVPFPTRQWVLLALGIPIGLILLLSFMVQVWLLLLNGGPRGTSEGPQAADGRTRFDSFLSASRNFSVLHLGFVILLTMLILWLIPSFLGDIAQSFFGMIREYQWFFLGVAVFAGGLLAWIIYLRYKLSRQMLDNQLEIEKYRLQIQAIAQDPAPQLLAAGSPEHEEVMEPDLKAGEP